MSNQRKHHSFAYLRFRRRLVTGLLLMAALAIGLVINQFRAAYQEREEAVRSQTEHYVKAIEAHVLYSIQFVDLSLMGFANAIKVLPEKQNNSPETINALLSPHGVSNTGDFWITYIDAKGKGMFSSRDLPVSGVDYSDRDYFKAHVNNSSHGNLFIGEPQIGRTSKERLFFLSRRVENARGEFLGVIAAPLNAGRFAQVFENSRFTPDVSVTLVHGDGKIIARAPGFDEAFGRTLQGTALFSSLNKDNAGTFKSVSVIDKIPRMFSYRKLNNFPLIVVVGSSDAESLRLLEKNSLIAGVGLALLLLLMAGGGHFSLRTYRKMEERETMFRALYATSKEMEQKLSASEQRLRLIADNLPVMIGYVDRDERYTFTNRKLEERFLPAGTNPQGLSARSVIGEESYADSTAYIRRAMQGEQLHFERQAGEHWHGVSYVPDKGEDGKIRGLFVMIEDITERKKNEQSMQLANMLYQNTSQGMMVTEGDGRILSINPAFSQMSGFSEREVIGKYAVDLAAPQVDPAFFDRVRHCIAETGQWEGEIWYRNKNGEQYLVWQRFNSVCDKDGHPFRLVALFSDITKKKASEELIWRQANFDTLTGLPNRRKFHEHLRLEMKKTERSQLPMALMFVDLDYFKEINDTLGHDKGDLLLKEVAVRLSQCVRQTDIVARLGGDEFTVIVSELRNTAEVARIAQDILTKMSAPFMLGEDIAHISSSIGITLYPDDGNNPDTLLRNADQAMYLAKQEGRNRFNYFAPFMQETTQMRLSLANELRDAVGRKQLRILFQPIIELSTGRISKAEALVRWQHPTRGLLNPVDFISIAENTGMIVSIGDWVFQQAAKEAHRLQQNGLAEFQVCVNKSAWQFRDEGSNYKLWLDFLDSLGLDASSIVIEVTENLLLDPNTTVAERLNEFQRARMQLSLDDFGTGYASVAFLKRFNVDYIKLDSTLVRNLSEGTDGIHLCEAIIAMAHKVGIKVIAEGIETPQQFRVLQAAGCDFGQGYLFSKPISGEELEKMALDVMALVDN